MWDIKIVPSAEKQLHAITDRRIRKSIEDSIDSLEEDPDIKGKPLLRELMGYRSLRAARQRYRIIYQVDPDKKEVNVVAVGIRKEGSRQDIYSIAKKLVEAGLFILLLLLCTCDIWR
jgi:mRNA interferase RelE/StbE